MVSALEAEGHVFPINNDMPGSEKSPSAPKQQENVHLFLIVKLEVKHLMV